MAGQVGLAGPYYQSVTDAKSDLESSEKELEELKGELGLTDRYFSDNPEYEALKAKVSSHEGALTDAVDRLDVLTDRLDETNEELGDLNDALQGEGKGFFASAKEMLDLGRIQEKAEQLIDSTLNLMALLTLKGIIIPVIFLVLILKGFRYIWGIDARALAAQQWQDVQSELGIQSQTRVTADEADQKK